jgi:hypothetical protein
VRETPLDGTERENAMSDTYTDDFDYDDEHNGPAPAREHAKKLAKQLADLQKQLEATKAENATLSGQVKKSSLASLLKAAGVPEKFAARADKDGADATEDGVKAWIEENKDFYNFGEVKPAETAEAPDGEPNVSPELAAAVRAGQNLDASGVTPSEVSVQQKLQSIDPSKFSTREELNAAIEAAGIKFD